MRIATFLLLTALAMCTTARAVAESAADPFDGVAFEWDYEGDDELESSGEGRSLLSYGLPRRFGIFVRNVVLNNKNNNCASFWELSKPRGTNFPAVAYRRVARDAVNYVTKDEMGLDDRRLRTLRMICRATRVLGKNNNNQRKIIRQEIIVSLPVDRHTEYNNIWQAEFGKDRSSEAWRGLVAQAMAQAPTDLSKWLPQRSDLVNVQV